ncbi:WD40-repeat-containing domain [Pseudocohnilembus persalinus]|uniref:WD40-repeat-containing domain n=1 Tax=Pseudocohnilembus persalinus TaxID=266149 RepID=A0A0V0RA01_PSEPJ|nr:WD40-repeat-containing domain [Pseudocohnilembus persalinus]|eukprot:KRX11109.1 WD40-repeat-containing domain [Pseudocohnilembus persalinus]
MGNFITILKQNSKQLPSKQTQNKKGYSLNKLREYHGTFKSICDTFAIDTKDFENIFGSNETNSEILKFDLWDTDKNKLIDALELFAGLIMFSNDNFSEKVRFLFDIFDFNELNSLSIIDIEFMLISCCNATFKIYSMQSDINEENISEFLRQDFKEDERINISQMIQWCAQKQEIIEFCQLIHAKPPEQSQKQIGQQQQFNYNKPVNQVKNLPQIINGKKYQQKLDWLSALSKKLKFLNQSHFSTASKDVSIKPKWVYGFRSQGVKKPLAHIKQGQTNKLIYFTANIVVIYYPNLNKQEHYLEHQREVISLGVAKKSGLVASGELGSRPAIHIWNNESLLNLGVIQGIHQIGINFINFFNNDEFIVTAGMRYNSPILIYNIKDLSLVLSTHINDFSLSVLTVQNYIGSFAQSMYSSNSTRDTRIQKQNAKQMNKSLNSSVISYIGTQTQQIDSDDLFENYENAFFIFTQSEIILFIYIDNHFKQETVKIHQMNSDEDVKDEIQVQGNLTCALVLRANSVNPYLKAYTEEGDGAVQIVFGTDKGYLYYFNWGEFEKKKEFSYQQHYQSSIVNLCSYKYGVIVGVGDSTIHLWDFNFQHNIKNLDLTAFSFKLFSYDIIDILEMNSQLLISTTNGDIIEIDMNQKQEWTQNKFIQKLNANRVNYITKFGGELNAMCIMERAENDDKILFAAGSAAVIYGFSLETHEIVDVWSIGGDQPITCMDCVNFEDGGTVFVFGTAGTPAKLIMRIDWEEQPRTLEIAQTVHDVKFSSDTYYLIACCNDYCIYLYQHNQNHYFNVLPKKIQLDNEIPISIDFVDDNKSFLVGTSVRNQYKIELPELKNKQILHENEKINCTMWTLRYPLHTKNFQQNMLPIIIGGDLKVFLCAGESGYLYFWRDHEQLETNCGGFLKGHASQISRIKMSQSQDVFFTLGQKDQTIIEWQVDFINDFNDFSKPFPSSQNMMLAQQSLEKQVIIKQE